jgi:endonuclease-3
VNTARAFASLKAVFPTWDAVVSAPTVEVEDAIRSGGLAQQKAPRIQSILSEVKRTYGDYSLDGLTNLSVHEARSTLTAMHGVGPKTASCVLLFSLALPALPVDTHVHRVSRRVGIIPDRITAEAAHEALEAQLPKDADDVYSFHMLMIRHGREICVARQPRCGRCGLAPICEYGQHLAHA